MKKGISAVSLKAYKYFWSYITANVCKTCAGFGAVLFHKYSTI